MVPKKSLLHINRCCGRGLNQVINLLKALSAEGIDDYEMHSVSPKKCPEVLEKHGLTVEQVGKTPYFLIEDNLAPCESLNNKDFLNEMVKKIKIIKGANDEQTKTS